MHCAKWVLPCLSSLFMEERRNYKQDHCLIVSSVSFLNPSGLQDFLYPQPTNRKKCCHGNTYCQVLPKTNQSQSMQGFGMQRIHKKIFKLKTHERVFSNTHKIKSKHNTEKKICHGKSYYKKIAKNRHHYSSSYPCKKMSSHYWLKSLMHGFYLQRKHQIKSKKNNRKSVAMATAVAKCCIKPNHNKLFL